jgi:hypothetical protein
MIGVPQAIASNAHPRHASVPAQQHERTGRLRSHGNKPHGRPAHALSTTEAAATGKQKVRHVQDMDDARRRSGAGMPPTRRSIPCNPTSPGTTTDLVSPPSRLGSAKRGSQWICLNAGLILIPVGIHRDLVGGAEAATARRYSSRSNTTNRSDGIGVRQPVNLVASARISRWRLM